MKVGDKVICIQDRFNSSDEYYNKKGKTYTILKLSKNTVCVNVDKNKYHVACYYSITDDILGSFVFNDYFRTLKEDRKIKLKKLND